ncbi:MAG: DNA-3-methyladenine glycosylase [Opitutales bacterium]
MPASFFQRPTLDVCRDLLGKHLCRQTGGEVVRWALTDLEAYDGPDDLASHAAKGMTPRNRVMFERGGVWYVYLCYGVHWMLNIVTGEAGYPGAILIRGAGEVNGPGVLTKELRIKADLNGKAAIPAQGLWIEDAGIRVEDHQISCKPRIGIGYAGPLWAGKPYRFIWTPGEARPRKGAIGMGTVNRVP